jgi:hypothetical protein
MSLFNSKSLDWRRFVHQQPIESQFFGLGAELIEVQRFLDVAICAQVSSPHYPSCVYREKYLEIRYISLRKA